MPSLNHLHLDSWIYKCFETSGIWKTSFLRSNFIWFVDWKAKERSTTARQASNRGIIPPEKSLCFFTEIYIYICTHVCACMYAYIYVCLYMVFHTYMMADCPRVYIHIYCPTAYRDVILQKHTLFYLQDDVKFILNSMKQVLLFLPWILPTPPHLSPQTCWKHNFGRAY